MPAVVSREHKRLIGRGPGIGAGGLALAPPLAGAPIDPAAAPEPPDTLGPVGAAEWRRLWAAGPWLLPDVDVTLMNMLCSAYDQRAAMLEQIDAGGLVMDAHAHPLLTALRTLEALITRWLTALGFTPTARSQLGISELTRVSKLEEMIARRANAAG